MTTHVNLQSPVTIRHTYADNIESLFYIFIWILILYDGPLGCKGKGIGHKNTLLSFWSEEASKNLETAKFVKFTFLVSKWSNLNTQIAPYFADLLPLAELWHTLLGQYVHKEASMPFDEVLQILDDFLMKMPDSEKPPVMVNMLLSRPVLCRSYLSEGQGVRARSSGKTERLRSVVVLPKG